MSDRRYKSGGQNCAVGVAWLLRPLGLLSAAREWFVVGALAPHIVQETVNLSLRGAPATKHRHEYSRWQSPMAQAEIASLRSQ